MDNITQNPANKQQEKPISPLLANLLESGPTYGDKPPAFVRRQRKMRPKRPDNAALTALIRHAQAGGDDE